MQGLVLKSTGKWYDVVLDDGLIIKATIRGKLRIEGLKTTNPIAAGDRVEIIKGEANGNNNEEDYSIKSILPRVNYIVRKSTNLSKQMQILAANVDHAYLVVTLKSPVTQIAFIDRFLVAAESFRIPTSILFNKVDLFGEEEQLLLEGLTAIYSKIGYACHPISAQNEADVAFLRTAINGKQVMISGNSGVGKTTLVNSLDPTLDLRTGEISTFHEQGKHTTTFAEMHKLQTGGYIIDTPGIRAFGVIDLEKEHYAHYFPEMRELIGECRFHNCQHLNEPHCAVKAAVEAEEISPSRYQSYVQLMLEDSSDPYRRNEF
ncbi:MAG: ribosome small subunit-dependent GTPase A [Flavobacteriales bacterium]|nr:ribosome small subunit-dependent GTPase A [Flavobacteriales bacterium]